MTSLTLAEQTKINLKKIRVASRLKYFEVLINKIP